MPGGNSGFFMNKFYKKVSEKSQEWKAGSFYAISVKCFSVTNFLTL